jgi:hypothetical protein
VRVVVDPVRESLVSSAGGVLLRQTIRVCGVERMLSSALRPWRGSRARHDPAKVLVDVATAVALGGDSLADVAAVRAQPEVFGLVASDPTVSRLITALAADIDASLRRSGPRGHERGRRYGHVADRCPAGPAVVTAGR